MLFSLGLIVALLISGLAIAAAAWPLLKKGPAPVLVDDDRLTDLMLRKEQVLSSIKELEFDYRVGKLSEADYQLYDQRLRRQAIGLIQQIEKVAPESAGLDASLEAEILKRRMVKTDEPTAAPQADDAIEAEIARRRRTPAPSRPGNAAASGAAVLSTNGGAVRFCTNCGNQLATNHKFCAQCGTPVEPENAASGVSAS